MQVSTDRRVRYRTSETTRVNIITAALRLIARQGISAVSYREIAAKAGQANSSAVQYHFGDKPALVLAIFEHYSTGFETRRATLLATEPDTNVTGLLRVLFLPYLDVVDEDGTHIYAAFVSQHLTNSRPIGRPYPLDRAQSPAPTLSTALSGLYDALSFLPPPVIQPRVQTATLAFVGAVMRWDSETPEAKARLPLRVDADDAIDQISAGIVAPFRGVLLGRTERRWRRAGRCRALRGHFARAMVRAVTKVAGDGHLGFSSATGTPREAYGGSGRGAVAAGRPPFAMECPIGSLPPNGHGLHDMIGNVGHEPPTGTSTILRAPPGEASGCCWSRERDSYDPAQPSVRVPLRVITGGSHPCTANYCRRYRTASAIRR